MTSSEIQETLIKRAADLITEDTPNYLNTLAEDLSTII